MADTEFNGVIKLTADTTEAEKKVAAVGQAKSYGGSAPSTPSTVSQPQTQEASAVSSSLKQIVSTMGNLFGGFGRTGAGAFNKVFGNVQGLGQLFGSGSKAAGSAAGSSASAGSAASAAAGGVSAAGAAAPAALAALGPIGIAVGAVAALGAISVGVAGAFKGVTEKIVDFARTLATVSPSMAITFAQFDRQMMLIKQQLGESRAPAINDLLNTIVGFVQDAAPYLALFVTVLSSTIAMLLEWFESHSGITGGIVNVLTGGISGGLGLIADAGEGKNGGKPTNVLAEMRDFIKDFLDEYKRNQNRNASAMVMQDFMKQINADGSAQRQYQDEFKAGGGYVYHAPIPVPRGP